MKAVIDLTKESGAGRGRSQRRLSDRGMEGS